MELEIVTADALGQARHGFFTRKGGASTGIFAGLNCGQGSSDQTDIVRLNRHRVSESLGLEDTALLSLHQIHSDTVHVVTEPWSERPRGDAMVSATPGIGLGILTADCAPVLFHDPNANVIGAAHAGWKGAVGGVLDATVAAMQALGASVADIRAAVGPCISQRAYEVGPEFIARFIDEEPETSRFFAGGDGDRAMFNLPAYCIDRLQALGVDGTWTGHCTYFDPSRFYSYRRTTHAGEPDYGRLVSAIRL